MNKQLRTKDIDKSNKAKDLILENDQ